MFWHERLRPGQYPSWIEVAGFKSIGTPTRVEMRPITLLAGANSSGKSSIFQPLLLLKQSLEVTYSADPIVLSGTHLSFFSLDQIFSCKRTKQSRVREFSVAFGPMRSASKPFEESGREQDHVPIDVKLSFHRKSPKSDSLAARIAVRRAQDEGDWVPVQEKNADPLLSLMEVSPDDADLVIHTDGIYADVLMRRKERKRPKAKILRIHAPVDWTRGILHLPGYRGHRQRLFPITKVTRGPFDVFSVEGPMPPYTASLLFEWQKNQSADTSARQRGRTRPKDAARKLDMVGEAMRALGLTWKVKVVRANAAELELRVGRMAVSQRGGAQDLVDIADAGYGLSQVLPVLVALVTASPGQMVLIEQPELHLHPSAQLAMGRLLAEAANRGVIVVVETHSQLLLRSIQTIVAQGRLKPGQVGLNWFSRDDETGWTTVVQADLQEDGSFGDWPVDFPDVYSMADAEFIDAVFGRGKTR